MEAGRVTQQMKFERIGYISFPMAAKIWCHFVFFFMPFNMLGTYFYVSKNPFFSLLLSYFLISLRDCVFMKRGDIIEILWIGVDVFGWQFD